MALPNGDSVAVTKACTTADPDYPDCLPAAQYGDKTWYYYYPQYATDPEQRLVPVTECSSSNASV